MCTHTHVICLFLLIKNNFFASLTDAPGLQYFTFHGNLNKPIYSGDPGELFDDVFRAKNGRWTLEKGNVILQEGDVINYWIYVQVNNTGSVKENQRYVVGGKFDF